MEKRYVVAVDLGGTKIYTALVDLEGTIIKENVVKTEAEKGPEVVMSNMKSTIDFVIEGVNKEEIKAIGIGSPGPLDVKKGMILETPNLPMKNYNLVREIEEKYGLPTYLDNDANAATLAEFMFGAGKGTENMVYVTVSTGIGGGTIINGKIYRGSTSNAAELGHTTVKADGPRCGCGNRGCAEAMSSGTAIMRRAKEALATNVRTALRNYEEVTAKEVFIEYKNGDAVAEDILNEALMYLGVFAANVANTFDPDMIVFGGGVINGIDIALDMVQKEFNKRALPIVASHCKLEKAQTGGKAGVLGAAAVAIME